MLKIEIKKNADGTAALTCLRPDATTTWQRQKPGQSDFFVRHDLTHFAVETELSQLRGFYGLIAGGWEIRDFGPPWPQGPLPAEAAFVEVIVGLLDTERASGTVWTAAEFNTHVRNHRDSRGLAFVSVLDDVQLRRIRQRRSELLLKWDELPIGERLILAFPGDGHR